MPHFTVARDIVNTALTNGWVHRINAYVSRVMPAAFAFLFARRSDFKLKTVELCNRRIGRRGIEGVHRRTLIDQHKAQFST